MLEERKFGLQLFVCIKYLECLVVMIKVKKVMFVDASWLTLKRSKKLDSPHSMSPKYLCVIGINILVGLTFFLGLT